MAVTESLAVYSYHMIIKKSPWASLDILANVVSSLALWLLFRFCNGTPHEMIVLLFPDFQLFICVLKKTQMRYEKTRWISELNNPTRVNHDHSFVEKKTAKYQNDTKWAIYWQQNTRILTFFDSFKSHIRHSTSSIN